MSILGPAEILLTQALIFTPGELIDKCVNIEVKSTLLLSFGTSWQ